MRRLLVPLLLLSLACRTLLPAAQPQVTAEPAVPPRGLQTLPVVTPPVLASPSVDPSTLSSEDFKVVFHPDGPLFIGDLVSIEVIAPQDLDLGGLSLQVVLPTARGSQSVEAEFGRYGLGGRSQATLTWIWDTARLAQRGYELSFAVYPDGPVWQESVRLHPADEVPLPEPAAKWAQDENDCCLVHYITGTDSQRDLAVLLEMIDEQFTSANSHLQVDLDGESLQVTLLPRVLGHGGFARDDLSVSYLDRNYAGAGTPSVLQHEIVHMLDGRLGGELRPTILIEGLAVYLTGGHFKTEPLMPRAAALLPPEPGCERDVLAESCGLDWYIDLVPLIENFYFEQHEIGYLQAGALVEFMVERWGWQAFSDFYRHITPVHEPDPNDQLTLPTFTPKRYGPQASAMDLALQENFAIDLNDLERLFIDALLAERLEPQSVMDVYLTVEYYNTARHYQRLLDPSAYFLYAWLPDNVQMRERGIVADYLRRPSQPENIALEMMLVSVDEAIRVGDYSRAEQLLAAVNAALDVFQ